MNLASPDVSLSLGVTLTYYPPCFTNPSAAFSPLAASCELGGQLFFFFVCVRGNQRLLPGTTSKQGLIIFSSVPAIIGDAEQTSASLIASAHLGGK